MESASDAPARKQIFNLAHSDDRQPRRLHPIEQCLAGGRQRVIAAIRGALETSGRADKRPGDHPADAESFSDEFIRDLARPIQLWQRHDVFVRRDLEDAVSRCVHDERAGAHVVGPELVENLRARGRLVAQHATSGLPRELTDDLWRKPEGKDGKGAIEDDAHQLPMAGHGILSR